MQTAPKKTIQGWAMYDWANSAYSLVISSTIFPAYYEAVTGDGNESTTLDFIQLGNWRFVNTALYNYTLAAAFLIVAILSPLLSSIADYRGSKKRFLFLFCSLGSSACCSLFFFYGKADIVYGLCCMLVACVGFWGSLVFYNSYLPEIAAPEDRDRISAKGFTMGYLGSVILQLLCFVFVMSPATFNMNTAQASQLCFLLVGIWWFGFGQYALSRLPEGKPTGKNLKGNILIQGYRELVMVWKQVKSLPSLKGFLTAFFFYNMGVQTVMLAATLYGKSELNIPTSNLIIAILLIQLVAIPGALLLARLAGKIGNINSLLAAVAAWILICILGYYVPRNGINEFYALAVLVGFVMGGIQSLSRSTYSKIMPETGDTTSFFSFFDVTEKLAIVVGMFSFGFIHELTGSQRSAVLALMTFFILGWLILFFRVRQKEKNQS
jgi:UMF1 family MFS transporter